MKKITKLKKKKFKKKHEKKITKLKKKKIYNFLLLVHIRFFVQYMPFLPFFSLVSFVVSNRLRLTNKTKLRTLTDESIMNQLQPNEKSSKTESAKSSFSVCFWLSNV